MNKTIPWLAFSLASFFVLVLAYLLLNAGSALDDARAQTGWLAERSDLALRVVQHSWVGRDQSEAMTLVDALERDGQIKGTPSSTAVQIGDIVFEFSNGKVIEVHYPKSK